MVANAQHHRILMAGYDLTMESRMYWRIRQSAIQSLLNFSNLITSFTPELMASKVLSH